MRIKFIAVVLLFQTSQCLASDDSPFELTNKATGFCLLKKYHLCVEIQWTTGDRLLSSWLNKCLGAEGNTVGSGISLYDCNESSELQRWECRNETLLALKGQELYIELTADNTAVLSKTTGPNNHLTISGTSSGACSRTYREYFTLEGNAFGKPCMFPFMYKQQWYSECTTVESQDQRLWCAVETKYENELWGYCPTNSKKNWNKDVTTGANYQLNTQSALTWSQADASCKQQSSSLLSITSPHEKAYITALLGGGQEYKLWTGLNLNSEHGWQWSSGRPYRYLSWDSGHPLSNPGHVCGVIDGAVQYSWQSSKCDKNLGYICHSISISAPPTEATEARFCSAPWIPYNGHCFHLNRTQKTWSDAKLACRKEGGDLVSIRNVEDQSFVISQLGYASTDELWIGLNDKRTEGLFDWSDHSTVSFTSWEYGKPSITTGQEDCVLIRGQNGNWADRVCTEKHGFICMKTSASEPSGDEVEQNIGCKMGWKKHGSYCYFVGTQTKTFDEAKDDCKSSDSYLADVSTGVDNAFLVSLVGLRSEKHFWLGLSNQKNIDVFVWTNTDSVKFTHWNTQMPGHQQGCVAMATGSFAGLWDVLPCTNKEKYICKHLAEGAVLTPVPPTVPSLKCADGWDSLYSRNQCYKLYTGYSETKTWYEARDYCRAIGGDLLSIHSALELRMLPHRYETVWIGFSAPDPVTGYVWSDGSPVNFQHWEDGEPNNKNGMESCAELKVHRRERAGSWNDAHCEKNNNWICQIRIGVTPKPPPDPVPPEYNTTSDGWLIWKGNQYYINHHMMAMDPARHFCQQRHGDLVTINSEAERLFLWKQISRMYGSYWIGLTVGLDRSFQWMDGSQVVFQSWEDGQPDFKNFDENCAAMSTSGLWHDYNCGFEHNSICKRSDSLPANTTVAPTEPPKGGCPVSWKKFHSKCYNIINNQNLTWEGARQKCQQMGGNLASISSRHVQVFLMSQMADAPTTDLWIGFHNLHHGQFVWTDGRQNSYTNLGFQEHDPFNFYRRHRIFLDYGHRWMRHHWFFHELHENNCAVINTRPSLGIGKWITKSCNDTNGFICLQNLVPSLPDSPEPTAPTTYVKILNDSAKAVPQQMNWEAAKKNCEGDDANLASLRNEWMQAYVELLAVTLKAPVWIGLSKVQTNGYFKFVDGWHVTLSHWGQNEPSTHRACVYMDVDGKWKTANCNQTMSSVCMKSTDVPPPEPTGFPGICPEDPDLTYGLQKYFWKPFREYCYIFFTESERWANAAASCVRHGGMLASIEDSFEQDFIARNVKTFHDSYTSFWMGLFKNTKEEWLWLDRTVMDYTNWREEQFDSNYGEISTSDGTWKADHGFYERPYICKTPKVLPPSPSPLPVTTLDRHRDHIILATVLGIAGIAVGAVIAFFIYKKHGHRLPILASSATFDNPLFFSSRQPQPDVVDTKKLIENAEEGTAELVVTI
ncbi:macrophage mannose receptor 1-like [Stegastes partitus]|uniref:Macrophage mannose receptor 1-like n=1 Tax=Stegastes partitus TaxID=144197 RepID=A0A9Y4K478_9TELE|nr:PREDICTED: macrophage mannose receptor 1-like [Stegastes partitus]